MKQYTIRPVEAADHERITSIYNHYIVNTIISFEEEIVSVEQMRRRIERVQTGYPYLVAEAEGIVVGYAYATHFRERHAYRFSTETTVYVDPQAIAAGCGTALYGELIADLKIRGFKMAIGGGLTAQRRQRATAREAWIREDRSLQQRGTQVRQVGRRRFLAAAADRLTQGLLALVTA
ncbi:MAG TPA: N-acetyltransferase family protein [Candidatus Latescibacteria bacterium]|jgi:phosphinothricin acetyltransferase|nr:N-acetyltransferase family protein [Candidatus Latescibacterota bacterium]